MNTKEHSTQGRENLVDGFSAGFENGKNMKYLPKLID